MHDGSISTPSRGHKDPGMFGRMFPRLPPLSVGDAKLQALAEAMLDPDPADGTLDNTNIPAGFTYLGQFIHHDITSDLTSLAEKERTLASLCPKRAEHEQARSQVSHWQELKCRVQRPGRR